MAERDKFSSKFAFIISSIGASIGLGILWMFPFKLCKYGGAAFLIPYFIFTILLGAVGLIIEFTFGRSLKSGSLCGIKKIFQEKNVKGGSFFGSIPSIGMLLIFSFYTIIIGWIFKYFYLSISGEILKIEPSLYFDSFSTSKQSLIFAIFALILTAGIISLGVAKGIEKLNKFAIPAMFVIFGLIVIRSVTLPGAIEGIKYICIPQWENLLNMETWIMAMGLAFFTASLSGSVMVVYGSYTDKHTDIPKSTATVILFNTLGAILSAFAIIPAVFAFGVNPSAGPSLLFISLPSIFSSMPFGAVISTVFFISVICAAVSTGLSMMEVPVEALTSITKLSRKQSTCIVFLLSLLVITPLSLNMNVFEMIVDFSTIILSPLSVLIVAIVFFWKFKKDSSLKEINEGSSTPINKSFLVFGKFIFIPLTLLVVIFGIVFGGIG